MSIHMHYEHQCLACGEDYLPFDEENRRCPKCGTRAREVEPCIPAVLSAAVYNDIWGCAVLSTGDHYVVMAMRALRGFLKADLGMPKSEEELDSTSEKLLACFSFAKCEHRIPHTKAFIKAVLREAYLKSKT